MDQIYNENAVVKTSEILKTFLYTKSKAKYNMQIFIGTPFQPTQLQLCIPELKVGSFYSDKLQIMWSRAGAGRGCTCISYTYSEYCGNIRATPAAAATVEIINLS